MGILDSSFLFMPLGNDLLMVAMTASKKSHMPYYAAMATLGSVLGCLLIDVIFRKGGEKMLEKHVPARRLDYIRGKVKKRAGWALAVASLAPPPFPFTPFIMAASTLEYPRKRLLGVIAGTRLVRFSVEGALAIYFGKRILKLAESPAVQWFIIGLIIVSLGGSVFSIVRWIQRSKRPRAKTAGK